MKIEIVLLCNAIPIIDYLNWLSSANAITLVQSQRHRQRQNKIGFEVWRWEMKKIACFPKSWAFKNLGTNETSQIRQAIRIAAWCKKKSHKENKQLLVVFKKISAEIKVIFHVLIDIFDLKSTSTTCKSSWKLIAP